MNYETQLILKKLHSKHMIDIEVIDSKIDIHKPQDKREVVRGVCIHKREILVVYPNNELIYGLPGGGIESNESHQDALKREMNEEVGAEDIKILNYLGKMTTFRKKYHSDDIFVPTHHLYLIDILHYGTQNLITYEADLGLSFKFVDIDEVIKTNEQAIEKRNQDYLDFYTNQTVLFKIIKDKLNL